MGLLDDSEPEVVLEHRSVSRRRNPVPLILGIIGLLALLVAQWPSSSDTTAAPELPLPSTTIPPPDSSSAEPEFSFPRIWMVRTPGEGGLAIAVPYSAAGEIRRLTYISSFQLDASGEYMAALGTSQDPTAPRLLFLGHIGLLSGQIDVGLRPIAAQARGFAWHDSEPGQLAFIEGPAGGPGSLRLVDATADDIQEQEVGVDGWLTHYGSWGFATSADQQNRSFGLLDARAEVVLGNQDGKAVGYVPTLGLVATLTGANHVVIDPRTGATEPLTAFASQSVLWDIEPGGPRGTYAVHATSADGNAHQVLVYNRLNEVIARLDSGPNPQAMTWNRAGAKLVFTVDDASDRTSLVVYDAIDGTTIETSFLEDPDYPRTVGLLVD